MAPSNFVELLVELFWSLQVYRKKTLTKSHDYSRLFSQEKRRLKIEAFSPLTGSSFLLLQS